MKLLVTFMAVLSLSFAYSQTQSQEYTDTRLFAQCMFSIETQEELDALTYEMYNNPNIEMVRLDMHTQRALIITANLEELAEDELISWFGEYSSVIYCVNIGVHGVDEMWQYPFTNCQEN